MNTTYIVSGVLGALVLWSGKGMVGGAKMITSAPPARSFARSADRSPASAPGEVIFMSFVLLCDVIF
jgi:hypothetical protein